MAFLRLKFDLIWRESSPRFGWILTLHFLFFSSFYFTAFSTETNTIFLSQESKKEDFIMFNDSINRLMKNQQFVEESMIIELLDWTRQKGDTNDRLLARLTQATYLTNKGEKQKGIRVLNRILNSPFIDKRLEFKARMLLRDTYFELEAFDKAMFAHKSLNWEDSEPFFETYAPSYFIAFVYLKIGNYKHAAQLMQSSIQKMKEHNFLYIEMSLTNSLGVCFEKMGELDSAMFYYSKALDILEEKFTPGENISEAKYNSTLGLFIGNKGPVLAAKGRHLEAIPLLKLDVYVSLKDSMGLVQPENGIISLLRLAQSYLATNQIKNAKTSIEQAESLIQGAEKPELWELLYKTKTQFFEKTGNLDSAYFTQNLLMQLKDSLDVSARKARSQNLIMAYESLIQDQERLESQREIEALKTKTNLQQTRNTIFSIILIFSLIIAAFATYRIIKRSKENREIQEKNKEILAQKIVIEKALKEKETLLREVNHRVKNNLQIIASLLFFQSKKIDDEQSKSALKVSQQRVQTMSHIHQKLYQEDNFKDINFQAHLEDLVRQIISSSKPDDLSVQLSINSNQTEVSVGQAVPLSLIIHELVTNSLKHGFEGRTKGLITITLAKRGISGILEYSDDGNGMLGDDMPISNGNIGIKVIQLLANQLKGEFEIVEKAPLRVRILFELD